jgi:hypothetical protein
MSPFTFIDTTHAGQQELQALAELGAALENPFDTTGAHAALDELQAFPEAWQLTLRLWVNDQYRTDDDQSWLEDVAQQTTADDIDAMLTDMAPNY